MSNQWKTFFKYEAPKYDDEPFTTNTAAEADFIERHLKLAPGSRVLDLGCGTGRHTIELARRGHRVTGVDLSEDMLACARGKAANAAVDVELICGNALDFRRDGAFDACICLCEGALSLFGHPDEPYDRDITIFRNMRQCLRPGGMVLATILNACRMIRHYSDADVAAGAFDVLKTLEISSAQELIGQSITLCERAYTPSELRLVVDVAGLKVEGIYGGTAGSWNLGTPRLDEIELMVIASR